MADGSWLRVHSSGKPFIFFLTPICAMEFDALMPARRSVRFFTERKIDRAIIEKIIDAGRYAPRASNRQHWEAIVVDEKEVIERLYYDGGAQKTVLGAPAVIVIVVDMRFNVANY